MADIDINDLEAIRERDRNDVFAFRLFRRGVLVCKEANKQLAFAMREQRNLNPAHPKHERNLKMADTFCAVMTMVIAMIEEEKFEQYVVPN